jgi:uncharacterized protein YndB with AHSA1/START domain
VTDAPRAAIVRRVLPASPSEVFAEWVDPEALAEWMCPSPAHATKVALDPRVGGRFRIDIEESGARFNVFGTYLEVAPPGLLRFSWGCSTWEDPTVESVVTVTLEPHGGTDTLMTISHDQLPPEHIENHERGWAAITQQLAIVLELRRATPPASARPHASTSDSP